MFNFFPTQPLTLDALTLENRNDELITKVGYFYFLNENGAINPESIQVVGDDGIVNSELTQERYQKIYDNLRSLADDTIHYQGTRIRGKALYYIYLLAMGNYIALEATDGQTQHDMCNNLLQEAANLGYEVAQEMVAMIAPAPGFKPDF